MIELKSILEAVLFSAQKPLRALELKNILTAAAEQSDDEAARAQKRVKTADIDSALEQLREEHAAADRSFSLACIADGWQFVSKPAYAPWLRVLAGERARPARLSAPALETLTIIAYRQPVTRAEIEQIRGVSIDGVMQTLLERNLIEAVGRAEVVGRPMQYGTTRLFLEYFGLRSLDDMPTADELRRIPVDRPPSLLTVEPGLATAPPEQLTLQPQAQSEPCPHATSQNPAAEPSPALDRQPAHDAPSEPVPAPGGENLQSPLQE